jgi:hypothetical protein
MDGPEVDQEVEVTFVCRTCGRGLGVRAFAPPLYGEEEFQTAGTPAFMAVEACLMSKRENETVDRGWSRVGPILPPLGIKSARSPRTGATRWEAEYGRNGVRVHIRCGCGRNITCLLATLVTEAADQVRAVRRRSVLVTI